MPRRLWAWLLLAPALFAAHARASDTESARIEAPFRSARAQASLIQILREFTGQDTEEIQSTVDFMAEIESYGYELTRRVPGCPFTDSSECKGEAFSRLRRRVVVRSDDTIRDTQAGIRQQEFSRCSHLELPQKPPAISRTAVTFSGDVTYKDNACGEWPTGGEWSYNNCIARGSWSFGLTLHVSPAKTVTRVDGAQDLGAVAFEDSSPSSRIDDRTCLSGLLDLDSVLGRVFDSIVFGFALSPEHWLLGLLGVEGPRKYLDDRIDVVGERVASARAVMRANYERGVCGYYDVTQALERNPGNWYIDPDGTGFLPKPGLLSFELTEVGYFPEIQTSWVWRNVEDELSFLKSLPERTRRRTVERGESLWSIAKDEYGQGSLQYFLWYVNRASVGASGTIYVGQELTIEPLWKLSVLQLQGRVVIPGDTLWQRYVDNYSSSTWRPMELSLPAGSIDPDSVFAFQVLDWQPGEMGRLVRKHDGASSSCGRR